MTDPFSNSYQTVYDRFPGQKGRVLRELVDSTYLIETVKDPIPLFHKDGSRVFERHQINALRENKAVVNQYKALIQEIGVVKDARAGRMIAVPDKLDRSSWKLRLIAGLERGEKQRERERAQHVLLCCNRETLANRSYQIGTGSVSDA